MLEQVLKTIRQHKLIPSGSRVVVGVSGGADSLALLHVLLQLRTVFRFEIHVVTIDHMTRGTDSAEDARFVVQTCEVWDVSVTLIQMDVPALALERGQGLELAAREARHRVFEQAMQAQDAHLLALAHHADDQAETVLMHLLRGAGTQGARGMDYRTAFSQQGGGLIRPLLDVTRTQIEVYCREHGLQPRHDATNDDPAYTLRNTLRHDVLPRLRTLNPQAAQALNQFAEIARLEHDFLEQAFNKLVLPHIQFRAQGDKNVDAEATNADAVYPLPAHLNIPKSLFRELHPALQRHVVRWALAQLSKHSEASYSHIVNAVAIAHTGLVGAMAQFPDRLQLRVDYTTIIVERMVEESATIELTTDVLDIVVPGKIATAWGTFIVADQPGAGEVARLTIPEGARVQVRTRRAGDRFAPLGMGGHRQKLSEWMVNHKVPRSQRERVPLLIINGEIAAIMMGTRWAIAEPFAVRDPQATVTYFLHSPDAFL